jgi:hypothetical protein
LGLFTLPLEVGALVIKSEISGGKHPAGSFPISIPPGSLPGIKGAGVPYLLDFGDLEDLLVVLVVLIVPAGP